MLADATAEAQNTLARAQAEADERLQQSQEAERELLALLPRSLRRRLQS
jgi:hypothetical protein